MAVTAVIGVGVLGAGVAVYEGESARKAAKGGGMPNAPDPNAGDTALKLQQAAAAQRRAQGSAATLLNISGGEPDKDESLARATLYGS